MFEHKEDKSGTTEAEWWGGVPDECRQTERQRGITPDRFPIHSVRSAPHRSPRTPPSIPSFRLSIHLIPHSFPVCLSANALQRSRLPCPPEWVSVGLMPVSGAASLRTNLEFRSWMEDRRTFHFQRTSRGCCNARVQEEMGSSNRWHTHDSPVCLEFRPKDWKMETK